MFRWHHRLKGHELEQTLGDSRGEKSLVCCSPWVAESDTTEGLNDNTEDQQGQVMCPRMSNIRVSAPLDEEARGCSMHSARKGLQPVAACSLEGRDPGNINNNKTLTTPYSHIPISASVAPKPNPIRSHRVMEPSLNVHRHLLDWAQTGKGKNGEATRLLLHSGPWCISSPSPTLSFSECRFSSFTKSQGYQDFFHLPRGLPWRTPHQS